jgi:hypothetical protein
MRGSGDEKKSVRERDIERERERTDNNDLISFRSRRWASRLTESN